MPSNLNFDHRLLEEAQKIGGFKYKKDAVNAALDEYISRHKQLQMIQMFNRISYDTDYDYKKGRKKR